VLCLQPAFWQNSEQITRNKYSLFYLISLDGCHVGLCVDRGTWHCRPVMPGLYVAHDVGPCVHWPWLRVGEVIMVMWMTTSFPSGVLVDETKDYIQSVIITRIPSGSVLVQVFLGKWTSDWCRCVTCFSDIFPRCTELCASDAEGWRRLLRQLTTRRRECVVLADEADSVLQDSGQ